MKKKLLKAADEARKRLSQQHEVKVVLTEAQLHTLRRRYEPSYKKLEKHLDNKEFTNELVVKFALWEAESKEAKKLSKAIRKGKVNEYLKK
jgi:predicted transcriptional regulator